MANFLRMAVTNTRNAGAKDTITAGGHAEKLAPREFRRLMKEKMAMLKMDDAFATRYLNEGFSGGEKSAPNPTDGAPGADLGDPRRDRFRSRH